MTYEVDYDDFPKQLAEIKEVYPEARIEADHRGMQLWQLPPPVRKLQQGFIHECTLGSALCRAFARSRGSGAGWCHADNAPASVAKKLVSEMRSAAPEDPAP